MDEVLWKLITIIIERLLVAAIEFHDIFYGLWENRGMGTNNLEANIIHQIVGMRQYVMYKIFVDLHKASNDLYREWGLMILEGYGMGPRLHRLLVVYWDRTVMAERGGGYYRDPFQSSHGVAQGTSSLLVYQMFLSTVSSNTRLGWWRKNRRDWRGSTKP